MCEPRSSVSAGTPATAAHSQRIETPTIVRGWSQESVIAATTRGDGMVSDRRTAVIDDRLR
ncbi:hypothetical protein GCM10010472_23800 [Pseudonocardia halophobica]|uniref:Uncharacterized protein n=1 Tax=Pseudonocardia halophobica TaxID=29401 RepID=A0A9W6NUH8_9PSEU|nr:hypothetical protein GCM10017577_07530 [Pseudonocardia halophobica]